MPQTQAKMMRIPFFRKGKHIDNKGNTHEFTESDLRAVVANYDPTKLKTPLVIGHPKDNHPAYGHINSLEYDESTGEVVAIAEATSPEFAEAVNAGMYGKDGSVSVAWYPKDSAHNPIQGNFYPRHLGFLGAVPPAIKGLSSLSFNDGADFVVYSFSEGEPKTEPSPSGDNAELIKSLIAKVESLDSTVTDLRKENAELKAAKVQEATARLKTENAEFCEGLIKDGKLWPAHRETTVALLNASPEVTLEFNEAQKPFVELLKDLLTALPKTIDFSEQAPKGNTAGAGVEAIEYDEFAPTESIELDQKIRRYMAEHNVDYTEAFKAVRPR